MWFVVLLIVVFLFFYFTYVNDESLSTLDSLLAADEWREACEETEKLLWLITERDVKGKFAFKPESYYKLKTLKPEEVMQFPCNKLSAIDKLWRDRSSGYFGISIQASIYYKSTLLSPSERSEVEYLGRGLRTSFDELKTYEDLGWHYRNSFVNIYDSMDSSYATKGKEDLFADHNFNKVGISKGYLPIFFNDEGNYPASTMIFWWKRSLACKLN
jgi:hypothetical protein